ncbi:PEP-CTERM sorting domain-containing protein [Paludisphaera borealis]|uniref:Ice-binding protein C-terminal domain-containing protein n=1 Tax=Paludisphaera borealis TaxID=1387353 RepID=A0A1U7CSD1_9BACT|nr:PEP-CTERM sorting domain-containing protein [Paludisphaera borealis]APW61842.1 hypothetical protein BSF38_03372 [Paludisphaera borealis]
MRPHRLCFTLLGLFLLAPAADASIVVFETQSTAVQTITSDLVPNGSITLNAAGPQQFTLDLTTGFANVVSAFHGSDFVTPLGTATYDLYNTATTGTITDNGGSYTIHFSLLFELKITSGPLDGVIFETKTNSIFETTVASLPFPSNTVFGDPARPNDGVTIFVKEDPNGVLASLGIPVGSPVGTSSNRVVTTLNVVPEPASLSMLALGVAGIAGYMRRRPRS